MALDEKVINSLQAEFESYIGNVTKTNDTKDTKLIRTGNKVLDLLFGGGIGRFTLLVGNPGSLKSTLCGNIAAQFQKDHPEGLITYIDSEHSMSPMRLEQLGLKNVRPKTNFTVEQVFNLIEAVVMFKEEKKLKDIPALVIWDSIANTPSKAELTAAEPKEVVGMKARVISLMLPKIMNLTDEYNIYILAVNQLRDRIVIGYGSGADLRHLGQDKDMPGGKTLKFAATQLLETKVSGSYDDLTSPYGQRATTVMAKTVKNKYFPDNYKLELLSLASTGFNDVLSSFLLLKQLKKVTMSAWSYLKNYPERKFRIKEILKLYDTDPKFKKCFDELVDESLEEVNNRILNYKPVENIPADDTVTTSDKPAVTQDKQTATSDKPEVIQDKPNGTVQEQQEEQTKPLVGEVNSNAK